MGLDIGPKTIETYRRVIAGAKTVIWNGPMGVFEIDAFAKGTIEVAKAVAAVKGTTVIGGGDSIAAVAKAGVTDRITHISTGGGASLEFLAGQNATGRGGAGVSVANGSGFRRRVQGSGSTSSVLQREPNQNREP